MADSRIYWVESVSTVYTRVPSLISSCTGAMLLALSLFSSYLLAPLTRFPWASFARSALGTAACAFAPSMPTLIAARAFAGNVQIILTPFPLLYKTNQALVVVGWCFLIRPVR
jgi:hypothetical protein